VHGGCTRLAGVDEIYRIGGAQAIAALAYGTESIKSVAKIVGPECLRRRSQRVVFGTVGIDMIAGRPEVLILAIAMVIRTGSRPTCWPRPNMM